MEQCSLAQGFSEDSLDASCIPVSLFRRPAHRGFSKLPGDCPGELRTTGLKVFNPSESSLLLSKLQMKRQGGASQGQKIKRYQLLYTKQISNKDIPYNTGNLSHYLEISCNGVCTKNIKSLCCTLETNIILQIKYISRKNKILNNNCWQGEKGTLMHFWWECKLVQPLQKTVWTFLKKIK